MEIARTLAGGFLYGYGVVSGLCWIVLPQLWLNTAPNKPMPALGLVYAYNNHGVTNYLSAFQTTSEPLLLASGAMIVFLGFSTTPKTSPIGQVSEQRPRSPLFWWGMGAGVVLAPAIIAVLGSAIVHALNDNGIVL